MKDKNNIINFKNRFFKIILSLPRLSIVQIIIVLSILFIVLYPFVLITIADLRAIELKILFNRATGNSTLLDSTGILARYKLWEKRSKQKVDKKEDYLSEIKLLAMIRNKHIEENYSSITFPYFRKLGFFFINSLNTIVGDTFSFEENDNSKWKILDLAYYEERFRRFHSAAAIYSISAEYFKNNLVILSNIYLHRGFCRSMINQSNGAMKDYKTVMQLDNEGELAVSADLLIVLLNKKNKKLKAIVSMKNSLRKAIRLYQQFSFYKSLNTLLSLKKNRTQKYYFYRGRAYEESGLSAKAIIDYKKVISMNSKTMFSKNANRRLYILGLFYQVDATLEQISKQNSKITKDDEFIEKITKLKTIIPKLSKEKIYQKTKINLEEKIVRSKIQLLKEEKVIEENKKQGNTKKNISSGIYNIDTKNDFSDVDNKVDSEKKPEIVLLDQIDTKEGNRFIGRILSINEYRIRIKTSVGIISITSDSVLKFSIKKKIKK